MRLSQIVEASELGDQIRQLVRTLSSQGADPDWHLAGRLAVKLQRRGYDNAAVRVQKAATAEDSALLGKALLALSRDRGIFPAPTASCKAAASSYKIIRSYPPILRHPKGWEIRRDPIDREWGVFRPNGAPMPVHFQNLDAAKTAVEKFVQKYPKG